ncbi:MAG: glycosyltransferase [Pseudomonadota bacterium]
MHILLVTNDLAYFRAHRERLALDLLAMGHEVSVASGGCEGADRDGWDPRLSLYELNLDKHRLRPLGDLGLAWTLRGLYGRLKPDVVHCITIKPILFGGIALFLAHLRPKTGPAMVWTFAGLGKVFERSYAPLKRLRRYLVQAALIFISGRHKVHCTFENESDKDYLIEKAIASPGRAYALMGTGMDLDRFSPGADRSKLPQEAPLVFFMGTRLIGEKGVDTYLAAAKNIQNSKGNARFLLAGLLDETNPDAIPLSTLEKAHKDGVIEFLGGLTQSEMVEAFRNADVSVAPTRLREGFPRALLEAAACGNAIVASDQIPMRVLVPHARPSRRTGLLISPPDTANLTAAFETMLNDPQDTRRMGKRARELVESIPVAAQDIADGFAAIYQQATRGQR